MKDFYSLSSALVFKLLCIIEAVIDKVMSVVTRNATKILSMNTEIKNGFFPGFDYHVSDVRKYIRAGEIFTIMLKSFAIVHYISKEADTFELWLKEHFITDIKK